MKLTVAAIARITGGRIRGRKNFVIKRILPPDQATKSDLTFLFDPRVSTRAAVIVSSAVVAGKISIVVQDAQLALFKLLKALSRKPFEPFIAASAVIDAGVKLPAMISVDDNAVLKKGVRIRSHTFIGANCYIDSNVKIGSHCRIGPNSVIFQDTEIGDHVAIGAGTVIGSAGFGFVKSGGYRRYHHVGTVRIGDYVEIGANCAIDRATLAKTVIGEGTKIDNLVHIAHNVRIGRNCLIMGQCGIAGSARLGDNVVLCGQVGVSDHVSIGNGSIVYAKSAVFKSVADKMKISGIPSREHGAVLRALARLYRES